MLLSVEGYDNNNDDYYDDIFIYTKAKVQIDAYVYIDICLSIYIN